MAQQVSTATMPLGGIQLETPKDSMAKRCRWIRWILFVASTFLTVYLPYWAVHHVGSVLGHPIVGGFIGCGIGVWLLGLLMPRMLVDNAEWHAYVTQNPLPWGGMVPYGPGLSVAFFWEQRNEAGNFPLGVIPRDFTLSTPTTTSEVTFEGTLFYNASVPYLTRAAGVNKRVVEDGLVAFIDSFISAYAGSEDKKAEDLIKKKGELTTQLNTKFRDQPALTSTASATQEEFEVKFGYSTAAITIKKIAYAAGVQETLNAISESRKMNEIAMNLLGVTKQELAEMLKNKTITVVQIKEMLDRAMVSAGQAKMNLNVVEGNLGAAAADFLTQGGKGGRS